MVGGAIEAATTGSAGGGTVATGSCAVASAALTIGWAGDGVAVAPLDPAGGVSPANQPAAGAGGVAAGRSYQEAAICSGGGGGVAGPPYQAEGPF